MFISKIENLKVISWIGSKFFLFIRFGMYIFGRNLVFEGALQKKHYTKKIQA
jgi:hypothetical protein